MDGLKKMISNITINSCKMPATTTTTTTISTAVMTPLDRKTAWAKENTVISYNHHPQQQEKQLQQQHEQIIITLL